MNSQNNVIDALLGVAIGDALGVPFEFTPRYAMEENPATDMVGYGTYKLPKGTWSDDSSLTFCLAESLAIQGYDLADISQKFIDWKYQAYWTARGFVFDIGSTTSMAIHRLKKILESGKIEELTELKNVSDVSENGNGSLMRILPLLFFINDKPMSEQFNTVWEVSALTHRHIRAAMSCFIYLKLAEYILKGNSKENAYALMRADIQHFWEEIQFSMDEQAHFQNLIQTDIREVAIENLRSGGYVIEVLESSIWFFLQKESYKDTVLSIINIGHDTDTSAAIAGGLAGLYYGIKGIPFDWVHALARKDEIFELGNKLYHRFSQTKFK